MADARTILAGGNLINDAYRQRIAAAAAKRERKKSAAREASEAFTGLGDAIKEYGDLKQAKIAEADMKQIRDADILGAASDGPEGRLVALQAIRPQTLKGAELLDELRKDARDAVSQTARDRLVDLQTKHQEMRTKEIEAELERAAKRDETLRRLESQFPVGEGGMSTEEATAWQLFSQGGISEGAFTRWLKQIRAEEKANADRAARLAEGERERGHETEENEKDRSLRRELEDRKEQGRMDRATMSQEGQDRRLQSRLDFAQSKEENAVAERARRTELDTWYRENILNLRRNAELRQTFDDQLDTEMDIIERIDMQILQEGEDDILLKELEATKKRIEQIKASLQDLGGGIKITPHPGGDADPTEMSDEELKRALGLE